MKRYGIALARRLDFASRQLFVLAGTTPVLRALLDHGPVERDILLGAAVGTHMNVELFSQSLAGGQAGIR